MRHCLGKLSVSRGACSEKDNSEETYQIGKELVVEKDNRY